MRKLIVMEWVSIDGYFDAMSMDKWFEPFHSESRAEFIQNTVNGCAIMIYGKSTYEMLYPHWSSLKNNEMGIAEKLNKGKKYVVSSTLKEAKWENSTIIRNDLIPTVKKLKQQDGDYILIQGSYSLLKPLMEEGLVDKLKLVINPYILGTGVKPFKSEINCDLEFLKFEELGNGVVLNEYRPKSK